MKTNTKMKSVILAILAFSAPLQANVDIPTPARIEIEPTVYSSWGWEIPANQVNSVFLILKKSLEALEHEDYAAFRRNIIHFGQKYEATFSLGRQTFPILEGEWTLNQETLALLRDAIVQRPSLKISNHVIMQGFDYEGRIAKGGTPHQTRRYTVRLESSESHAFDYAGEVNVDCESFSGAPLDADDNNGRNWLCKIRNIYLTARNSAAIAPVKNEPRQDRLLRQSELFQRQQNLLRQQQDLQQDVLYQRQEELYQKQQEVSQPQRDQNRQRQRELDQRQQQLEQLQHALNQEQQELDQEL